VAPLEALLGVPYYGAAAVRVTTTFRLARPTSHMRTNGAPSARWRAHPTGKPDRDNLEKALLDALTGLLWIDDAQVCAGEPRKRYTAPGESPGAVVVVELLDAS
jgi:Holliday junction resolvase RusA-like endonuclease